MSGATPPYCSTAEPEHFDHDSIIPIYLFCPPPPPAPFHLSARPTLKGTNINPRLGCPPSCRRYIQPGCICQRGTRADLSSIKCRHHSSRYNKPGDVCDAPQAAFQFLRTICTKSLTLCRDANKSHECKFRRCTWHINILKAQGKNS